MAADDGPAGVTEVARRETADDRAAIAAFMERRVPPGLLPIVARVRALMAECAPNAREVLTYGILGWRQGKIVAVLNPTPRAVTFSFSRGASFADRHGHLVGEGRVSRHVKLRPEKPIDDAALRDYIRQAVELEGST